MDTGHPEPASNREGRAFSYELGTSYCIMTQSPQWAQQAPGELCQVGGVTTVDLLEEV